MFRYNVNPDSEIPIYRQLVDQINAQIRSGALRTGTQMPTVREMAERLHLSCGTVKRVYDTLQEMGDIEMTRRRGTFVKYVREDRDSRKIRAMTAIDQMIRNLSDLNFSPAEIQIFLNLKMREWGMKWSGMRIAVVTEYTELSAALEKQLGKLANVHVNVYSMRQFREYPYSVDEQCDVLLVSVSDGFRVKSILPDGEKLIEMAFSTDAQTMLALAEAEGERIGLVCENEAFAELVRRHLPAGKREKLRICGPNDMDFDVLIVPEHYGDNCPEAFRETVDACREQGKLLEFAYPLDEGSMLYLQERISRIRDERQHQPVKMQFRGGAYE